MKSHSTITSAAVAIATVAADASAPVVASTAVAAVTAAN